MVPATVINLYDEGIEFIEDLKLYPEDVFYELFQSKKFIVKQMAKIAYQELANEEFDFKRATKKICLTNAQSTVSILKSLTKSTCVMNKSTLAQKLTKLMPIEKNDEQICLEKEVRKKLWLSEKTRDLTVYAGKEEGRLQPFKGRNCKIHLL